MNRHVYSTLLIILMFANLATLLLITPPVARAQAPGVTADIEVLSPLNVTDPLLVGKNISIYLDDCCLVAVIDIESLENQGVDVGLVDVLFTPDSNWWGLEVLKYIDLNSTTGGWLQNPSTGNWYSIIRSHTDPNIVMLVINLTTIDLENAVVNRYDFGDVVSMNLYRKPLWLRIRDYNPPSPPDSALSVNRFAIIKKPDVDWDSYITVSYSYGRDKAKIGTQVTITVNLPDEIKYLLNITGGEPELTFQDFNIINITMYNLDESSDADLILSIIDGTLVDHDSKYLGVESVSFDATYTTITITGTLQEFAPLAVHEDASFEPKAYYGFEVYLKMNKTSFVDYGFNLTEIGTPTCPNTIGNDTLAYTVEFTDSVTESYVEVWASVEITETYPYIAYDPTELNPEDVVKFTLHNVPVPFNDTALLYTILFDTDYTDVYVPSADVDYLSLESSPADGILVYNVTVPHAEWGGLTAYVTFFYRSIGYEIRISELPSCDPLKLTVYPYADLYVLRNLNSDIVYMDGVIYRQFVHYSETDYTTAPGDYILVKGYGFITTGGVDVYLNDTIKLVKLLEINKSVDPGLDPGQVILVLKVNDTATGHVIPPAPDNDVTVTGTLYPATNTYTLATPLQIDYRSDLLKILVNPGLVYDAIIHTVYVSQTRLNSFDVYYDLVDDPSAPGGDRFEEATWTTPFVLEVIGMESSDVTVRFVNTDPHGLIYNWITINLEYGYAIRDIVGETIPFIAYGLYTIDLDNGTQIFVPEAINGSNVFIVHTNLDIDTTNDDTADERCQDVTLNVVGALPNDVITFVGDVTIYISTDMFGGPSAWRTETISIDVNTDANGMGSATVSGITLYDTTELTSDVHSYMDGHTFSGSGSITFTITYNATFNYYTNGSLTIWHSHWGTNTERKFALTLQGTTDYYEVVDAIDWSASIHVPRTRIVVTVPETIMPGDNITIQIVVHKTDVPHDQIVPEEMWDLMYPYWISVRLVDLSASTPGSWNVLYGGWLSFDSTKTEIVLPNGKVAKLVRVLEDVDGDGVDEVVFLVVLPAPDVLHDVTLRVDVNITLAFENTGLTTNLDLEDYGCSFFANYTGERLWAVEYTNILYGGDDQLTTVLGLLESKLDKIMLMIEDVNGTVVYIKAKVDDIYTYLTVDLMDFLEAMNNSIITRIDNGVATIVTKLGEVNMSLSDLMTRLASEIKVEISDSKAEIITKIDEVNETLYLKIDECCSDLSTMLSDLETTILNALNDTKTTIITELTGEIGSAKSEIIYSIQASESNIIVHINSSTSEVLSALESYFSEVFSKLTSINATIEYYGDTLVAKIDELGNDLTEVNKTLYMKIEDCCGSLANMISELQSTVLGRLDELEANVIYTVLAVNGSIVRHIDVVADDLRYSILLRIDEAEDNLSDLITVKADELKFYVNETATTIVAKVDSSTLTIINKLGDIETLINNNAATIKSDLASIKTDTSTIISALNSLSSSIEDKYNAITMKLDNINESLTTLVINVGDELKMTITGKAEDILNFLNDFKSSVDTGFSDLSTALSNMENALKTEISNAKSDILSELSSTKSAILANLSSVHTDLANKLSDAQSSIENAISSAKTELSGKIDDLSTKADNLSSDLKEHIDTKTDAVNSNVTTFSLTLLILVVVLIGLVGYSIIAARKVK